VPLLSLSPSCSRQMSSPSHPALPLTLLSLLPAVPLSPSSCSTRGSSTSSVVLLSLSLPHILSPLSPFSCPSLPLLLQHAGFFHILRGAPLSSAYLTFCPPSPPSLAPLSLLLQHAGFFHILLGSVVLLSLGPSVEIAFGSFGFFAAYFTGGVFGNLMSFWETAEVTVGGTVSTHYTRCYCKPLSLFLKVTVSSVRAMGTPRELLGDSRGHHGRQCEYPLTPLFSVNLCLWKSLWAALYCTLHVFYSTVKLILFSRQTVCFSLPFFFCRAPSTGFWQHTLVYLYRNRQAIGKEEAESSLWSLILLWGPQHCHLGAPCPLTTGMLLLLTG